MKESKIKRKSEYMIYSHDTLFIKEFYSYDDCKHWAINHLDQSHEIIIRIIKGLIRKDKMIY